MAKKILLAGVLGGVALFMWGGLSHMVLGLGDTGIQALPQQDMVMGALKASTSQSGFYFFPNMDANRNLPADKVGGAYGIVIYHPLGASAAMGGHLVNEFVLNVVLALLAAYLLSLATSLSGYAARVGFVAVLGLTVTLMTHVEFWNWYGFPMNYTVANIFDNIIGFLIVGLVAAAFVKPVAQQVEVAPAKAA
jgi:hypothetical protein